MEYQAQTEDEKIIGIIENIFGFIKRTTWFTSAFIALALFILIKTFLWDFVKVNNKDMQNTYYYGELLLVKKAIFSYANNDVLYFEYPVKDSSESKKTFMFQRIAGLPGDSVELVNKILFVNNARVPEISSIKKNYFIETDHKPLDSTFKAINHLDEGGEVSNDFDYSYSLTKAEYDLFKQFSAIKKIELKSEKPGNFDENCFPYSLHYKLNMDYYGKVYVPKKNDTLRLDTVNINLYSALIKEENNTLEIKRDSIFISGILSTVYVAKQNYFFMLGDNRDNTNDSRSWGFLPEKYVVGKVISRIKK